MRPVYPSDGTGMEVRGIKPVFRRGQIARHRVSATLRSIASAISGLPEIR